MSLLVIVEIYQIQVLNYCVKGDLISSAIKANCYIVETSLKINK